MNRISSAARRHRPRNVSDSQNATVLPQPLPLRLSQFKKEKLSFSGTHRGSAPDPEV